MGAERPSLLPLRFIMEDFEYDVRGAELIYTDQKPPPYNPLRRIKPRFGKMLTALALYLVLGAALTVVCSRVFGIHWIIPAAVWTVAFLCVVAKRAVIWIVRLYQYLAPDDIRLKCVFYPSCSEYMILAVQKYGTIRGVIRGIARLQRCHEPYGGEDFP